MKKIICSLFLISAFLFGCCSKTVYYEDFESNENLDLIFEDWKENRESFKYYFIDCRSVADRKKACHPYFDYVDSKSVAMDFLKNAKKNSPIILMGQNEDDENPRELKMFLLKKGFKNVSIYLKGFENYLEKEDFKPNTNCSLDCGCN